MTRSATLLWIGLICSVPGIVASCGYRFVGGEPLPGGIRSVFVPLAKNRSAESGMESVVVNALRQEIVRRGLTIGADRAGADAVLTAVVVRAAGDTITRSTTFTALERNAVLTATVNFVTADGARNRQRTVTATEAYPVTEDLIATDRQRRLALEEAAERLAQQVLDDLAAEF